MHFRRLDLARLRLRLSFSKARDRNRPRRTRRALLEENIRYNIYNGVAALVSVNLVIPFLGIFGLRVGATNTEIGLITSLPAMISLVSALPAAFLVDRCSNHKHFTVALILLTRFLYTPLALIPFFPSRWQPILLLAVVTIMTIPQAFLNVAWQSIIGSAIPPEVRSDSFAERSIWMTLSGTVSVLLGGWIMDHIAYPVGYQVAFVASFLAGIAEAYFLNRLVIPLDGPDSSQEKGAQQKASREHDGKPQPAQKPWAGAANEWRRVRGDRPYFWFLLATLYFHFAWMGAWPLFTIYRVEFLHANNVWMSLATVASSIGSVVTYRWWSRLSKRKGYSTALIWSSAGIAMLPAAWIFVKDLWFATLMDFVGGAATAGIGLGLLNRLLEVASDDHRATDVAYFNMAVQLAATTGPMLWTFGYERLGWGVSMGITAIARALSVAGYWLAANAASHEVSETSA
ncbi:MAG TPA: MFS transporter [Firmicutes bacterium]|nr:MFS transporter [Bacillota bacterium]